MTLHTHIIDTDNRFAKRQICNTCLIDLLYEEKLIILSNNLDKYEYIYYRLKKALERDIRASKLMK